jgi:cytochrome-b5 reductase
MLLCLMILSHTAVNDILVREELEALAKEFPDRFQLHYTVDRPPEDGSWKYSTGFITKEMLEKYMLFNGSSDNTQVFMCGPPPMIKFACLPNLTALGFTEKSWFSF